MSVQSPPDARASAFPSLFSFGFRPFFLLGALWGALAAPLWVWSLLTGGELTRDWHVHEMLFGFLGAVLGGFVTTAAPNWTGRPPLTGGPLAALVGLWILGRVAMLGHPGAAAAVADSAFLLVLAAYLWREALAARNWRNLPIAVLVTAFGLANVASHLGASWSSGVSERLALSVAALLMALIGGRIIPTFTGNWLRKEGVAGSAPPAFGRLDQIGVGVLLAAGLAWTAAPQAARSGVLLALAGAASVARLARWRGWAGRREPLLWILHLGYAWLGLGLILLGLTILLPAVPRTAGVHALTAGAVGVLTLAVMTRASRGHTGRPLHADAATVAIYAAVNLAAVLRVAAPFVGGQSRLLELSAVAWSFAFAGFALVYGRMLSTPRPSAA